jgi:pilus assembly protein Flp/PilA
MTSLYTQLVNKFASKKGQTLVEYGLILALVSVVVITVLSLLGNQINNTFNTIIETLDNVNNG